MSTDTYSMRVTVNEIVQRVFPQGTNRLPESGAAGGSPSGISQAPGWPPDAFAVAALLLERAGVYQLLSPGTSDLFDSPWKTIDPSTKTRWMAAGDQWRLNPRVPDLVRQLWDQLLHDGSTAIFGKFPGMGNPISPWIEAAIGILIIADQASVEAGYLKASSDLESIGWVAQTIIKFEKVWQDRLRERQKLPPADGHLLVGSHTYSVTQMASQDLVAVQPKAKTSQVGATLRTMTHNLALLPPPSRMAATWQRTTGGTTSDALGLNLLLVPFPYEIEPEWFEGIEEFQVDGSGTKTSRGWGWFDLRQKWLPADKQIFVDFVSALIRKAELADGEVDGVIFPEYSVSWEYHEALVEHLAAKHPGVEFVVSGSRTNCEANEGNFAITSSIGQHDGRPSIQTNSRGKHHRWRLDKGQIETYGLDQRLNPALMWWEGIALHRRQVHTHVFRNASCFTTFICEDLARSDPGHETVRALGPSIVFCLLMDSVQIKTRWPARYATGLSEDPGTSVLTFTSRALIHRANEVEGDRESKRSPEKRARGEAYARAANWAVAMWKNDTAEPVELHCPPGDQAILLSLKSKMVSETTYDDRELVPGTHWEFKSAHTIRLGDDSSELRALNDSPKIDK